MESLKTFIISQKDETVEVENATNWEKTTIDERSFFQPISSNTYVPVSEVSIETESSALFANDADGNERINPEGASNVEDYAVGYKKCHYSLPAKVKRKIKKTRKRPNQFYMEHQPRSNQIYTEQRPHQIYTEQRPLEDRGVSLKRKETATKLTKLTEGSEMMKRCESSEDEVAPSNEERNSLLLSQTSSDYPGAWSDNYTNTRRSVESLNDVLDLSDVGNEKLHFLEGNNSDEKPVETSQMTSVVDRLTAMNQHLSDWDSSDEDDDDSGYRKRATKIENCYEESDDSDDDDNSVGYKKRANKIEQIYVDDGEESDEDSDKDSTPGNKR